MNSRVFEEVLKGYSAEKREMVRQAYDRFQVGDYTEFFGQLVLILDVYGDYLNRLPDQIGRTNQETLRTVAEANQQIKALIDRLEHRTNTVSEHFDRAVESIQARIGTVGEQMDGICHSLQARNTTLARSVEELSAKTSETHAFCLKSSRSTQEATERLESVVKQIGTQIDTRSIAHHIEQAIESTIRGNVIRPFIEQTQKLASEVLPTLAEIGKTARTAKSQLQGRIWSMALASSLVLAIALAIFFSAWLWQWHKKQLALNVAQYIASIAPAAKTNQIAFVWLAAIHTPIHVEKFVSSLGVQHEQRYVLYLDSAYAAEMRDNRGYIFFTDPQPSMEWEDIRDRAQEILKSQKSSGK